MSLRQVNRAYRFLADMGDKHVYFEQKHMAWHLPQAILIVDMCTGKTLKDRYGDPRICPWPPFTRVKWKHERSPQI
jgi:hypothetical protein